MAALRRQQRRPLLPSFSAETTVTDAMRARMEYLFHSETVILRLLDLKAIVKYMGTMITGYITLREGAGRGGKGRVTSFSKTLRPKVAEFLINL